jgi:hypothetical protein
VVEGASAAPACPAAQVVEANPCIEYLKYIIFPWFSSFEVKRNEANGGDKCAAAAAPLWAALGCAVLPGPRASG